jgi:hypothetical protein
MALYKCFYFKLDELVSPDIFKKYRDVAWQFLDSRLLVTIDAIRVFFDVPMTINNWKTKGPRVWSGFRERACPIGASESQHRMGRAADIVCSIPANEMRDRIMANPEKFQHLSTIEDGVDWLHVDVRQADWKGIRLINP